MAAVYKHPRGHWADVAREMPHRTDNQVRASLANAGMPRARAASAHVVLATQRRRLHKILFGSFGAARPPRPVRPPLARARRAAAGQRLWRVPGQAAQGGQHADEQREVSQRDGGTTDGRFAVASACALGWMQLNHGTMEHGAELCVSAGIPSHHACYASGVLGGVEDVRGRSCGPVTLRSASGCTAPSRRRGLVGLLTCNPTFVPAPLRPRSPCPRPSWCAGQRRRSGRRSTCGCCHRQS